MPRAPRNAPAAKKPRRRRDAAVARADILDAAERRLVVVGPAGIRLQEVAADAGVSHPTVLHHFGSREALVEAVITRSLEDIQASLVAAIQSSSGEEGQLAAMIEAVHASLSSGGHARVILWLALEGHTGDGPGAHLTDVVDAAHALRKSKRRGKSRPPPREDTAHTLVLAALALLGAAVVGPTMLANAGLGADPPAGPRFRAWLARLLWEHLENGGAPRS